MLGRILGVFSVTMLLALSLSGCTQIKSVVAPVTKPKITTIEATVAAPNAPVIGRLAASMPDGLPLWPGSRVLVSKATRVGGGSWTARLSTLDPYKDVVAGVGVGFERANWTVETLDTSSAEMSSTILTVSGPVVDGVVTIATAAKGTVQVGYVMTPKSKN